MDFPAKGGVGRAMGSNGRKGEKKQKQSKPGPKAKKANWKAQAKKKAEAMREIKARQAERRAQDDLVLGSRDNRGRRQKDGLLHSVINPNGNTRTFEQNLVFLTLFCSLYEREAVKQPV